MTWSRRRIADPVAHFWSKVDQSGGVGACWPWKGGRYPNGYGKFHIRGRGAVLAHRFAFEIATGNPPPADMDVCHVCDDRPCCNPKHLWLGTRRENLMDAINKGRLCIPSPPRLVGEECGASRLKGHEVTDIYRRVWAGEKQQALADEFGVKQPTISDIKLGRKWSHLTKRVAAERQALHEWSFMTQDAGT